MDLNDRVDEAGNVNKTLGFLFQNAGYSTFHVGKWHQGLENNAQNAGYDESYIWSNERHDSMIYCHNGGDFQDLDRGIFWEMGVVSHIQAFRNAIHFLFRLSQIIRIK